ncbi:glycoside hydrolase family 88 protein [Yeosuana sp. AK3]
MIIFLTVIIIILIFIIMLTFGFDLFLYFRSVFYRIHIGRFIKEEEWLKKISAINQKWLGHTPTVKLTDSERYVILDIYRGKFRKKSIQSWQEAGVLLGALEMIKHHPDTEKNIKNFINKKIDLNTGNWKEIPEYVDSVLLAYAIAKYQPIKKTSIKPMLDATIALIERNKGDDGTIFYRNFIPDIRFVDTIGFVCPFLTYYGISFDKPEYVNLAYNQIKTYLDKAFLKDQRLPAHAYNIKTNIPLGIYGWGRGSGWFILGLVDMFNELPENHAFKKELKQLLLNTAKSLIELQRIDGGFNAVLTIETRHDSSITTIAGWLFLNAYLVSNDSVYLNAAKKCIKSLMKVTRRNGAIDFCQGDTKGIGVYATTFEVMPFVQGLTIRLAQSLKKYYE